MIYTRLSSLVLDSSLLSIKDTPGVCISHKEDVDGIASAALLKAAFENVSVILVDYANIISTLEKINLETSSSPASTKTFRGKKMPKIFICDLGLNKKNEQRFMDILSNSISKGYDVTYIDHHDLSEHASECLIEMGVSLIHSIRECTSVQVYSKFKRRLKPDAAFYAAAGALSDYLENGPRGSSLITKFDRQFLMLESSVLSYMISANQHDNKFLGTIVDSLSSMKYPHEIEGGFLIAEKYAKKIVHGMNSIKKLIVEAKEVAYVQGNAELSAAATVNFVLGASDRGVAMVYKLKDDINSYVISIRGSKGCKVHLGRLVNDISSNMGGSGGGHDKAAGAVIPKENFIKFIEMLDRSVSDFTRSQQKDKR
jgi:single-stranded-DNA-specific exonuclease